MLLPEDLDTFVTVGIPEPVGAVELERRLCSRCGGELEATVSICEPAGAAKPERRLCSRCGGELEATVSICEPAGAAEPERRLCSRCGELEATVSICESCFLDLAALMAVREPVENSPHMTARWIQWLGILLVGLIVIAAGWYLYVFPTRSARRNCKDIQSNFTC